MRTRAATALGLTGLLALGTVGMAFADTQRSGYDPTGTGIIVQETNTRDENGQNYVAEERTDWRDLDAGSPAELYVGSGAQGDDGYSAGGPIAEEAPGAAFVNTTADPKGCVDDNDPSDCKGGAISAGVLVDGLGSSAVSAGDATIADGGGTLEVYVEDGTEDNGVTPENAVASQVNQFAVDYIEDYSTPGDDDDGHECEGPEGANGLQACDDETNVIFNAP